MFTTLSFLNPAFLTGLAAAAVPVLLHLVYRRKAKIVLFPDLRFLKQIDQRISRRHRIEEWLLLALRMGVLSLLAIALAKPLWRPESPSRGPGPSTAAILILDDSYSMEFVRAGVSSFDRARKGALDALSLLRPADQVAILPLNRLPAPGEGLLSADPVAAREALAAAEPSQGTTPLAPALGLACELLASSTTTYRDIYFFTDLQRTAWEPVLAGEEWRKRLADYGFFLVDAGAPEGPNLAVTSAEVATAHQIRGVPGRIAVTVSNPGTIEAASSLSIWLDGRRLQDRPVSIPPGTSLPFAFSLPCEGPGFHHGEVVLDGDAVEADNHRHFVLEVRDAIRVLIANGNPSSVPHLDAAYYLSRALRPGGDREQSPSIIATTVCKPEELADYALGDFAVVVLAELAHLPAERVAAIADFVERGGGLLTLCGPGADPERLTRSLGARDRFGGLLPARVTGTRGDPARRDDFVSLRDLENRHPIFAPLLRADPPIDLGSARFYATAILETPSDSGVAAVLARFDHGDPALVEKRYGAGRSILFAAPAGISWSNFPLKIGYLPFLHNLVYYLSGAERAGEDHRVGQALRLVYPEKLPVKRVSLTPPGGEPVSRTPEKDGTGRRVGFHAFAVAGAYGLSEELEDVQRETLLAVNVDTAESDLRRADPKEVGRWFGSSRFVYVPSCDEVAAAVTRRRHGLELWAAVLLLALGLLLFEGYYANRIAFGAGPERR
ncbi:MAG: BatA domain-containing protein [Planctomycetes bacterium]|nr:BatA domain-containing protein [Planctomycetota bacterium]